MDKAKYVILMILFTILFVSSIMAVFEVINIKEWIENYEPPKKVTPDDHGLQLIPDHELQPTSDEGSLIMEVISVPGRLLGFEDEGTQVIIFIGVIIFGLSFGPLKRIMR